MERRGFLGGVIAIAVAGCTSDGGSGESGDDTGDTTTPTGESTSEEGIGPPTLVSHDIARGATGGYDMAVTVKNTTDQELNRAVGEVAVFSDSERLATGRAAAIDLSPGISAEESALLEAFSADAVTHYTITMVGETEDYEETRSTEHEFTGDEFREKLGG